MKKLEKLFGTKKPIIGMIHLAGQWGQGKIDRALMEAQIYDEEGFSGIIVENLHGSFGDLTRTLEAMSNERYKSIIIGVNHLTNPLMAAFSSSTHGGKFIQINSIQGNGFGASVDKFNQFIFGGVGFKYQPKGNNLLGYELRQGMERCDAIVINGYGAGIETSIPKLIEYKKMLEDFPLIIGGGLTSENAYEQLKVADGAIVGRCLKPDGNTWNMIDRDLVRGLMDSVGKARGK